MLIKAFSLFCYIFLIRISKSLSAKIPNKDVIVKSGGLVVKDKSENSEEFSDTLSVFTKISDDFEKTYRSVGGVSDFSKVVVGMMDSLKNLETKGDEMVKKISSQESRLSSVLQEIAAKEEYVKIVDEKVKDSENIFNEIQSNIRNVEERKLRTEEATLKNSNKIKAQEVRLKRLLKDISTKVSYVNVVDTKIKEMESNVDSVTLTLDLLENEKTKLAKTVKKVQDIHIETKKILQNMNEEIVEKETKHKEDKEKQKKELQEYKTSMTRMKEDILLYESRIEDANNTLSDLEKNAKEVLPIESKIVSTGVLYPAFALSLLFNFVIGGQMLSQVPSTIQQLGSDLLSDDPDIGQPAQYRPSGYQDENINDTENNQEYDPILQLEKIKKEKENTFRKKSDFDFYRRSNFPDLAYSYK